MIAHVAQSGEDRGRVLIQIRSRHPSAIALEAAVHIARAFGSDLESLFVEDAQLFDCAAYGFVREVSLSGRQTRPLSLDTMMRDLHLAAQGTRRQLEALARKAEVPLRCRVVRDEPLRALTIACAELGPWNVVTLGEPFAGGNSLLFKQMLSEVSGTTGIVTVGPRALRVSGPVIVAVEDMAELSDMLRTAERVAAVDGAEVVLLLVGPGEGDLERMEGETRLVVEDRERVRIELAAVAHGADAHMAETLRKLGGGMVICRFGGLVVPDEGDLRPLAAALECPLFLVRPDGPGAPPPPSSSPGRPEVSKSDF
ncbi:MAG: hypothetical protein J2P50_02515 [Hyphomicrobiaceae bacterium]|nr:hypothetical protein [Hyphomicrobiaceae bacterium]